MKGKSNRDWIVGVWDEVTSSDVNQRNVLLVADQDLVDYGGDELTVVRIIGDVFVRPLAATSATTGALAVGGLVYVHQRIYVAQETDGAVDFHNPALADNVDVPFLWHRVDVWERTAAGDALANWVRRSVELFRHQERPSFDLGVARRLADVDRLAYSVNGSTTAGDHDVTLVTLMNLRCLVIEPKRG